MYLPSSAKATNTVARTNSNAVYMYSAVMEQEVELEGSEDVEDGRTVDVAQGKMRPLLNHCGDEHCQLVLECGKIEKVNTHLFSFCTCG